MDFLRELSFSTEILFLAGIGFSHVLSQAKDDQDNRVHFSNIRNLSFHFLYSLKTIRVENRLIFSTDNSIRSLLSSEV